MVVVGSELRTTWKNNECYSAIPAFWQQQRSENIFNKIPHKTYPDVILGLYTNYTPDFSLSGGYYSLIIGSPVTRVAILPKDMVVKEIPAAKYAVFTAKGPLNKAIAKTWMEEIWQNKDIERTFANDFEWYDSKSTDDEHSIVKIYISIK
jgi:predicted transcriptional regulator YdeE